MPGDASNDLYIAPKVGTAISAVLLLLGAGVGSVITWYVSKPSGTTVACSEADLDAKYQSGFAAAKDLVVKSSIGSAFLSATDVRMLTGYVSAVSDGQLTLHTPVVNPFDDQTLADRTVLIASSTTVVVLVPKDPTTYQKQLAAYVTASKTANPIPPPAATDAITKSAADLKLGDSVKVFAVSNIKSQKTFTAAQIQILTALQPSHVTK